eukprot:TRINITY_DN58_c6_g2_i9.p2 TRINITY_DN58_c6_g2~~TRINITY_DN58_c6_g2_i9.p2  ORF type:complete len:122 (+),score=9.58 TRINITY_DN58_c6_g2_i9:448-813(+)
MACVLRQLVKTSLQPKQQRIYLEWETVRSGTYHAPPTVQELKITGMALTQRYAKHVINWLRRLRWYAGVPTAEPATTEPREDRETSHTGRTRQEGVHPERYRSRNIRRPEQTAPLCSTWDR